MVLEASAANMSIDGKAYDDSKFIEILSGQTWPFVKFGDSC